jgi:hypothetical protein
MERRKEDLSLGELFSELSQQILTLMRQEVDFAKTEVTQKVSRAGRGIAFLAVGGMVAYAGLLALIAAAILWLTRVLSIEMSALLIGLAVAGIGLILLYTGYGRLKRTSLKPQCTIQGMKEDKEWIKDQMTGEQLTKAG